jgi:hypothetical protein
MAIIDISEDWPDDSAFWMRMRCLDCHELFDERHRLRR